VDQGAGLHQFERGDGRHHLVGVQPTGAAVAPVRERRAQPLAAAEDERLQDVGHLGQRRVDDEQPGALRGKERGQRLVDPIPQAGPFQGRRLHRAKVAFDRSVGMSEQPVQSGCVSRTSFSAPRLTGDR
jgi:hypothetical protein